jgi:hypothetical protein
MSRITDLLGGGHPEILAGRGPTGGGRTAGWCSPARSWVGDGEESGDTLSVRRGDLKALAVLDLSATRLA